MDRIRFLFAGIMLGIPVLPGNAAAQVVQLPSYRVFQMPLNVVVPDRGTAFAGGTSFARDVRSTRGGWFPHSDFRSSSRGANSVHVSATIIDHRELDAAVLAQAQARQTAPRPDAVQERAAGMQRQILAQASLKRSAERRIAQDRVDRQREIAKQDSEARDLIRQGDANLARGQTGAARIFYRTALRHGQGRTRNVAQQRLSDLTRRP